MPYEDEIPPWAEQWQPPAELNDLSRRVIGAAIEVHEQLGPGLPEEAYLWQNEASPWALDQFQRCGVERSNSARHPESLLRLCVFAASAFCLPSNKLPVQ